MGKHVRGITYGRFTIYAKKKSSNLSIKIRQRILTNSHRDNTKGAGGETKPGERKLSNPFIIILIIIDIADENPRISRKIVVIYI